MKREILKWISFFFLQVRCQIVSSLLFKNSQTIIIITIIINHLWCFFVQYIHTHINIHPTFRLQRNEEQSEINYHSFLFVSRLLCACELTSLALMMLSVKSFIFILDARKAITLQLEC